MKKSVPGKKSISKTPSHLASKKKGKEIAQPKLKAKSNGSVKTTSSKKTETKKPATKIKNNSVLVKTKQKLKTNGAIKKINTGKKDSAEKQTEKKKAAARVSKKSLPQLKTEDKKKARSKPYPIVAIGASAGGLEAIRELLLHLPADTGMAYVYLQHLDPTHESMLTAILSKATKMPVLQAKNLMRIEPDTLFILPPNKTMSIIDGVLKLSNREAKPNINMPVNDFFMSLAEKQKEGAIGIILSGSANDGAAGLKAIKNEGGLTFAQDESARFQGMPRSAIAEGSVDMILSPKEIAGELERLSKQTIILKDIMNADEEELMKNSSEEIDKILHLIRKTTGVDFTHYKKSTISRRIVRRMLLYKKQTLDEYAQYLRQNIAEINILYQDLLINVTTFFRDVDSSDYIRKNILPKLIATKSSMDPIRIWIPGCASGEEAYSMAILVMEALGEKGFTIPVQVFATDLSESAIAKARVGIYSASDLSDLSPARLQRFFLKVDGHYRIVKSIRDLCVFAPHNVLRDPPFSRLDIISCCNLLIYLDTLLQKKLFSTFHYALNPGGYLILGKSETITNSTHLFSQIDKKVKIFQAKKQSSTRSHFDGYDGEEVIKSSISNTIKPVLRQQQQNIKDSSHIVDIEKSVDNILLNRFVPPSVVVNIEFDILQFRGSTGMFLEPAPGRASLNLLKMARQGLVFELRRGVHKVAKSGQPYKKTGLEINYRNVTHIITLQVIPLPSEGNEKYFMVLFEDVPYTVQASSAAMNRDKKLQQLEQELIASREDTRMMMEDQEAVREELQSANEEIVSSNEELQSINEELETSKEELESTNEELMTINSEVQIRHNQLSEAYEYTEAVFSTIRESAVVLDTNLRIKSANRAFFSTFRLKEEDVEGILIYELANKQWDIPELRKFLEEIVPKNSEFTGFEVQHTFPSIGEKVLMLNARCIHQKSHQQQFIILAIEDITEYVIAQRLIAEREQWYRTVLESLPQKAFTFSADGIFDYFNQRWYEYSGQTPAVALKKSIEPDLIYKDDYQRFTEIMEAYTLNPQPFEGEFRFRNKGGEFRWHLFKAIPMLDKKGKMLRWTGTLTDVHERNQLHDQLKNERRVLSNLLMQSPGMFCILKEPEHKFELANPAFMNNLGKDNILGKSFKEVFPLSEEQGIIRILDNVYRTGKTFSASEMPFLYDSGENIETRFYNTVYQALYDVEGKIEGVVCFSYEVTEQVKAANIIEAERARLYEIFMNAPALVMILKGEDLEVEYVNKLQADYSGKTQEEYKGKKITDLFPDFIDKGYYVPYEKGLEGESFELKEVKLHIIKNGKPYKGYFHYSIRPLRNIDGNIDGVISFGIDVTDQVIARKAIEESEAMVRNILNGLPLMAWMTDETGQLIFENQWQKDFFSPVMRVNYRDVIHPDDLQPLLDQWKKYIEKQSPFELRIRYKRGSDGEFRWHLLRAAPVKKDGQVSYWVGTSMDIHEQYMYSESLKETVTRIQSVLEALPQMAWIFDPEGNINFVNKQFVDYTGLTLQDVNTGKLKDIIHPHDIERFTTALKDHLISGKKMGMQMRIKQASNGEYRWHQKTATPIRDNNNNIVSWVGTNTDIHDQRLFTTELEERVHERTDALIQANKNLEQSNDELKQFAYVASHDLQEPLRKIITFSNRVQDRFRENKLKDVQQYIDKISESSSRMSMLINDLLNYSRSARNEKDFKDVNLNAVIQEVLGNFDLEMEENRAEIVMDKLPVIKAIPVQMIQLFQNLLSNAIKFRRDNESSVIEITCKELKHDYLPKEFNAEKSIKYIDVVIHDNGIGFDQKFADQIFVIFQRLHDKQMYPGTGIGLALCKKIVANHNGYIYAESNEKTGTSFHIVLPVKHK